MYKYHDFIKSVSPIRLRRPYFEVEASQRGNYRATNVVYVYTRETKGIVNFSFSQIPINGI